MTDGRKSYGMGLAFCFQFANTKFGTHTNILSNFGTGDDFDNGCSSAATIRQTQTSSWPCCSTISRDTYIPYFMACEASSNYLLLVVFGKRMFKYRIGSTR